MKTIAPLAVLAASLLTSAAALAQEPEKPTPADEPDTRPPCRLTDSEGFDDADSRTAARLVCNQLGRAGAPANAHYRVSLGKLGSTVILSVAQEGSTPNSTVDVREMRLQGVEEVEVAAPRIADSLVHGTPIAETEKVDNIVGGEARVPKTKPGKVHFALGLAGYMPPLDQGQAPSPGVLLDLHYETGNGRLELGGAFRAGGGNASNGSPTANFVMFSTGGRYYTSDADLSPYVGGGLSWGYLYLALPGQNIEGGNSGLGAYVDAGLQILRTHSTHLALGARLDLPFYALNTTAINGGTYVPSTTPSGPVNAASTYYYAPLSLEMRLTF